MTAAIAGIIYMHNEDGCDAAFPPEASRAELTAALAFQHSAGRACLAPSGSCSTCCIASSKSTRSIYSSMATCPGNGAICANASARPQSTPMWRRRQTNPDPTHDSDGDAVEATEDFGSRGFDYDGVLDVDDGSLSDLESGRVQLCIHRRHQWL